MKRGMLAGVVCLLLGPATTMGQNLVVNGDFAEDLSGWEVLAPSPGVLGTIAANHEPAIDALDIPDSGSALIEWDLIDPLGVGSSHPIFRTCTSVSLDAEVLLPGGWAGEGLSAEAGSAFIRFCEYRSAADCSGGSSCGAREILETSGFVFDDFFRQTDPEGAQGVGVEVFAELEADGLGNATAQGSFRLDKVYFRGMEEPALTSTIDLLNLDGMTASFAGTGNDGQSPYQALYIWDFGDGTESTEQNPTHTYSSTGTFQVSLLVNTGFEQAIDQIEVLIEGPPVDVPTIGSIGIGILTCALCLSALMVMRRDRRVRVHNELSSPK